MTTAQQIAARYRVELGGPLPIRLPAARAELPALCRALGVQTGAEVGVWKGAYSELFCRAGVTWTAIDPWAPYAAYREKKNDHVLTEMAYAEARRRLAPYDCTLLRMDSRAAAARVPDGSLGVCYIDGNHEAPFVREDLELWTAKVKPGGLLAGHDYRVPPASKPFIQVKQAVDAFLAERGIAPWFLLTRDATPSFLWVVS
jgi:hypothetical protein